MSTLQTLDRGITALFVIASRPDGISIADLSSELDVPRASAYRIVNTLEAHGLIRRGADGALRLGGSITLLAAAFWPGFLEQVRPVLQSLAEASGATSFLSIAQGRDCIVVATAEPSKPILRVGYRVGSRHPLDRGAAGVAILAGRPAGPDDAAAVRAARLDGFSVTRGQLQPGAVGVATWIVRREETVPELSIGIVALEGIDVAAAAAAVLTAASESAALT
ncbi:IclR family transcriptional regulator [Microbacterium sp. SSM24]|uniref:IclR family transcriptional regulator n=1 Tax=Microbacterium sp. SSM24 TaxID=2991714 RepID=UPI002227B1CA|nr:helix-turn-helix domain-containing protein [Microbacterium sp. SSM24]MCW3492632.1 helix-turn-helix domain-containing protein [Microbacterium sp. SSM24]